MDDDQANPNNNAIELATELTIAWLNNPNVRASPEDVPAFLRSMHTAIGELSKSAEAAVPASDAHAPAVPVRSSIKPDYLISLIDGRKFKSLKRHLSSHGLTPKDYRERYGLKSDYPMVAPNYSAARREVAQKLGLGRKKAAPAAAAAKSAGESATKPAAPKAGRGKAAANGGPKAAPAEAGARTPKRRTPKAAKEPAA